MVEPFEDNGDETLAVGGGKQSPGRCVKFCDVSDIFFKCVVDFHCSFHSNHGTHEIARFRFYGVFGCFSTNCSPTRLCFVMFCVHVIGSLENTNSRKGKALTAL